MEHFFQVSYSLTELAKTQLNKNRKEIAPHDIPRMFQSSHTLMELVSFAGQLVENNFLNKCSQNISMIALWMSYVSWNYRLKLGRQMHGCQWN